VLGQGNGIKNSTQLHSQQLLNVLMLFLATLVDCPLSSACAADADAQLHFPSNNFMGIVTYCYWPHAPSTQES
jgi:hypothetical protein